jgi:hypothetical protein
MENVGENNRTVIKPKYYDSHRRAMLAYVERQKDIKHKCEVCGKEYTTFAKSKHYKSNYHLSIANVLQQHGIVST